MPYKNESTSASLEITLTNSTDDNYNNCVKSQELGWNTAHLVEEGVPIPKKQASKYQIRHLEDLRATFPQFFKTT